VNTRQSQRASSVIVALCHMSFYIRWQTTLGWILGRDRNLSSRYCVQNGCVAHWFRGLKRRRYEADISPPSQLNEKLRSCTLYIWPARRLFDVVLNSTQALIPFLTNKRHLLKYDTTDHNRYKLLHVSAPRCHRGAETCRSWHLIWSVLYDSFYCILVGKVKGRMHPCTGTESMYRPNGP